MSGASKCDRCGVLFEPKVGDLVLSELNKYVNPPKDDRLADTGLWQHAIYDADDEYDLCGDCSRDLLAFLEPITRPAIGRES